MPAYVHRGVDTPSDEEEAVRSMNDEGLRDVSRWGNDAGDTYGWHEHPYEKVLTCVRGGIVFHTDDGDVELGPGDRMVLPPGTSHAATVGPNGVRCVEAPRYGV